MVLPSESLADRSRAVLSNFEIARSNCQFDGSIPDPSSCCIAIPATWKRRVRRHLPDGNGAGAAAPPALTRATRGGPIDMLSAALTVATAEEIKQLFLEFQMAGVIFFQTLRREPWGARNFIVKDPDGNLLLFAGPAE
jgi:hypothetical protein